MAIMVTAIINGYVWSGTENQGNHLTLLIEGSRIKAIGHQLRIQRRHLLLMLREVGLRQGLSMYIHI